MPHRLLIALLALSLLAVACGGSGDDAPPPAEQPAEPAPREPTDLSPQPAVAVVPDVPGPSADLPDANATDEQAAPFVFEFPAEPPVPDELVTFTVSATDAADPAQTPTRVTFLSSSLDPVFVELSPVASSTRAWVGEARFPSSGAWQALISTPDDTIVGPSIVISADLRPSVAGAPPPHFLFEPPALTLTAPLDVRDWPADDEPIASTLEPGASINRRPRADQLRDRAPVARALQDLIRDERDRFRVVQLQPPRAALSRQLRRAEDQQPLGFRGRQQHPGSPFTS